MPEIKIGKVEDYFGKVGVIAFHVEGEEIAVGDTIHVKGHTTDFQEVVESIQIDKQPVQRASPGSNVGIKTSEKARKGDIIYKVVP